MGNKQGSQQKGSGEGRVSSPSLRKRLSLSPSLRRASADPTVGTGQSAAKSKTLPSGKKQSASVPHTPTGGFVGRAIPPPRKVLSEGGEALSTTAPAGGFLTGSSDSLPSHGSYGDLRSRTASACGRGHAGDTILEERESLGGEKRTGSAASGLSSDTGVSSATGTSGLGSSVGTTPSHRPKTGYYTIDDLPSGSELEDDSFFIEVKGKKAKIVGGSQPNTPATKRAQTSQSGRRFSLQQTPTSRSSSSSVATRWSQSSEASSKASASESTKWGGSASTLGPSMSAKQHSELGTMPKSGSNINKTGESEDNKVKKDILESVKSKHLGSKETASNMFCSQSQPLGTSKVGSSWYRPTTGITSGPPPHKQMWSCDLAGASGGTSISGSNDSKVCVDKALPHTGHSSADIHTSPKTPTSPRSARSNADIPAGLKTPTSPCSARSNIDIPAGLKTPTSPRSARSNADIPTGLKTPTSPRSVRSNADLPVGLRSPTPQRKVPFNFGPTNVPYPIRSVPQKPNDLIIGPFRCVTSTKQPLSGVATTTTSKPGPGSALYRPVNSPTGPKPALGISGSTLKINRPHSGGSNQNLSSSESSTPSTPTLSGQGHFTLWPCNLPAQPTQATYNKQASTGHSTAEGATDTSAPLKGHTSHRALQQGPVLVKGIIEKQGPVFVKGIIEKQGPVPVKGINEKQGPVPAKGVNEKQGPVPVKGVTEKQGPVSVKGIIEKQGPVPVKGINEKQGPVPAKGVNEKQGPVPVKGINEKQGPVPVKGVNEKQGPVPVKGVNEKQGPVPVKGINEKQGPVPVKGVTEKQGSAPVKGTIEKQGPVPVKGVIEKPSGYGSIKGPSSAQCDINKGLKIKQQSNEYCVNEPPISIEVSTLANAKVITDNPITKGPTQATTEKEKSSHIGAHNKQDISSAKSSGKEDPAEQKSVTKAKSPQNIHTATPKGPQPLKSPSFATCPDTKGPITAPKSPTFKESSSGILSQKPVQDKTLREPDNKGYSNIKGPITIHVISQCTKSNTTTLKVDTHNTLASKHLDSKDNTDKSVTGLEGGLSTPKPSQSSSVGVSVALANKPNVVDGHSSSISSASIHKSSSEVGKAPQERSDCRPVDRKLAPHLGGKKQGDTKSALYLQPHQASIDGNSHSSGVQTGDRVLLTPTCAPISTTQTGNISTITRGSHNTMGTLESKLSSDEAIKFNAASDSSGSDRPSVKSRERPVHRIGTKHVAGNADQLSGKSHGGGVTAPETGKPHAHVPSDLASEKSVPSAKEKETLKSSSGSEVIGLDANAAKMSKGEASEGSKSRESEVHGRSGVTPVCDIPVSLPAEAAPCQNTQNSVTKSGEDLCHTMGNKSSSNMGNCADLMEKIGMAQDPKEVDSVGLEQVTSDRAPSVSRDIAAPSHRGDTSHINTTTDSYHSNNTNIIKDKSITSETALQNVKDMEHSGEIYKASVVEKVINSSSPRQDVNKTETESIEVCKSEQKAGQTDVDGPKYENDITGNINDSKVSTQLHIVQEIEEKDRLNASTHTAPAAMGAENQNNDGLHREGLILAEGEIGSASATDWRGAQEETGQTRQVTQVEKTAGPQDLVKPTWDHFSLKNQPPEGEVQTNTKHSEIITQTADNSTCERDHISVKCKEITKSQEEVQSDKESSPEGNTVAHSEVGSIPAGCEILAIYENQEPAVTESLDSASGIIEDKQSGNVEEGSGHNLTPGQNENKSSLHLESDKTLPHKHTGAARLPGSNVPATCDQLVKATTLEVYSKDNINEAQDIKSECSKRESPFSDTSDDFQNALESLSDSSALQSGDTCVAKSVLEGTDTGRQDTDCPGEKSSLSHVKCVETPSLNSTESISSLYESATETASHQLNSLEDQNSSAEQSVINCTPPNQSVGISLHSLPDDKCLLISQPQETADTISTEECNIIDKKADSINEEIMKDISENLQNSTHDVTVNSIETDRLARQVNKMGASTSSQPGKDTKPDTLMATRTMERDKASTMATDKKYDNKDATTMKKDIPKAPDIRRGSRDIISQSPFKRQDSKEVLLIPKILPNITPARQSMAVAMKPASHCAVIAPHRSTSSTDHATHCIQAKTMFEVEPAKLPEMQQVASSNNRQGQKVDIVGKGLSHTDDSGRRVGMQETDIIKPGDGKLDKISNLFSATAPIINVQYAGGEAGSKVAGRVKPVTGGQESEVGSVRGDKKCESQVGGPAGSDRQTLQPDHADKADDGRLAGESDLSLEYFPAVVSKAYASPQIVIPENDKLSLSDLEMYSPVSSKIYKEGEKDQKPRFDEVSDKDKASIQTESKKLKAVRLLVPNIDAFDIPSSIDSGQESFEEAFKSNKGVIEAEMKAKILKEQNLEKGLNKKTEDEKIVKKNQDIADEKSLAEIDDKIEKDQIKDVDKNEISAEEKGTDELKTIEKEENVKDIKVSSDEEVNEKKIESESDSSSESTSEKSSDSSVDEKETLNEEKIIEVIEPDEKSVEIKTINTKSQKKKKVKKKGVGVQAKWPLKVDKATQTMCVAATQFPERSDEKTIVSFNENDSDSNANPGCESVGDYDADEEDDWSPYDEEDYIEVDDDNNDDDDDLGGGACGGWSPGASGGGATGGYYGNIGSTGSSYSGSRGCYGNSYYGRQYAIVPDTCGYELVKFPPSHCDKNDFIAERQNKPKLIADCDKISEYQNTVKKSIRKYSTSHRVKNSTYLGCLGNRKHSGDISTEDESDCDGSGKESAKVASSMRHTGGRGKVWRKLRSSTTCSSNTPCDISTVGIFGSQPREDIKTAPKITRICVCQGVANTDQCFPALYTSHSHCCAHHRRWSSIQSNGKDSNCHLKNRHLSDKMGNDDSKPADPSAVRREPDGQGQALSDGSAAGVQGSTGVQAGVKSPSVSAGGCRVSDKTDPIMEDYVSISPLKGPDLEIGGQVGGSRQGQTAGKQQPDIESKLYPPGNTTIKASPAASVPQVDQSNPHTQLHTTTKLTQSAPKSPVGKVLYDSLGQSPGWSGSRGNIHSDIIVVGSGQGVLCTNDTAMPDHAPDATPLKCPAIQQTIPSPAEKPSLSHLNGQVPVSDSEAETVGKSLTMEAAIETELGFTNTKPPNRCTGSTESKDEGGVVLSEASYVKNVISDSGIDMWTSDGVTSGDDTGDELLKGSSKLRDLYAGQASSSLIPADTDVTVMTATHLVSESDVTEAPSPPGDIVMVGEHRTADPSQGQPSEEFGTVTAVLNHQQGKQHATSESDNEIYRDGNVIQERTQDCVEGADLNVRSVTVAGGTSPETDISTEEYSTVTHSESLSSTDNSHTALPIGQQTQIILSATDNSGQTGFIGQNNTPGGSQVKECNDDKSVSTRPELASDIHGTSLSVTEGQTVTNSARQRRRKMDLSSEDDFEDAVEEVMLEEVNNNVGDMHSKSVHVGGSNGEDRLAETHTDPAVTCLVAGQAASQVSDMVTIPVPAQHNSTLQTNTVHSDEGSSHRGEKQTALQDHSKEGHTEECAEPNQLENTMDDPIPIPKGAYNLDFLDQMEEEFNPFQTKSKISSSPSHNSAGTEGFNPFQSRSKLAIEVEKSDEDKHLDLVADKAKKETLEGDEKSDTQINSERLSPASSQDNDRSTMSDASPESTKPHTLPILNQNVSLSPSNTDKEINQNKTKSQGDGDSSQNTSLKLDMVSNNSDIPADSSDTLSQKVVSESLDSTLPFEITGDDEVGVAPAEEDSEVVFKSPDRTIQSPSKNKVIQPVEEEENWVDRTSVITKQDHADYVHNAEAILGDLVTNLPVSPAEPAKLNSSVVEVEEGQEEEFVDAEEDLQENVTQAPPTGQSEHHVSPEGEPAAEVQAIGTVSADKSISDPEKEFSPQESEPIPEEQSRKEAESQPEPAVESQPEPVVESQPEPVLESQPEPVVESQPEAVLESQPEPVLESQPEPTVELQPEPLVDSQPEPAVESEPEPVVKSQPEPAVESQPEPVLESQTEPAVELQPKPSVELQPEPAVESEPEPAVELPNEPAVESLTEPIVESQPEPTVVSQPEPTVELPNEPAVELPKEPAVESLSEPVVESQPEPVAETQPKPTIESQPEPVAESQPEPTIESQPEPVAESQPEPTIESQPEPVAESQPEPTIELQPEPVAESQPEPTIELQPDPTVESQPDPTVELRPEPAKESQPEPAVDSLSELVKEVQIEANRVPDTSAPEAEQVTEPDQPSIQEPIPVADTVEEPVPTNQEASLALDSDKQGQIQEPTKSPEPEHLQIADPPVAMEDNAPGSPAIPISKGSYNLDFLDHLDENINPFATKVKMANSPPRNSKPSLDLNGEDFDPFKPKSNMMAHSPPHSPRVVKAGSASNPQPVAMDISPHQEEKENPRSEPEPPVEQKQITPKKSPTKKKSTTAKKAPLKRNKFRPPPSMQNKTGDSEDIQIFMPEEKKEAASDVMIFAPPPPKQESDSLEARLSQPESQSSQESAPSHTESAPNYAEPTPSHMEPAPNHIEAASVHFGDENGLLPEPEVLGDDDFQAASSEFFNDPAAWDMLDKFGGGTEFDKTSTLARQSLYVKFDPLVKGSQSPAVPKSLSRHKPTVNTITESDDLLLMSTPPAPSSKVKHPAARVLEEAVEEDKPAPEVDRLFNASPVDKHEGDGSRADITSSSPPKPAEPIAPSGGDALDIVQVLKYSQSDVNRIRKEWELDTQARLLAQAKQTELQTKLHQQEIEEMLEDKKEMEEQNKQLKKSNEEMKTIVSEFEKTVSQVIEMGIEKVAAEKENTMTASKDSVTELVRERDQALEDLQSVETAFSDLHRRYEKSKSAVEGFRRNEDTLKKCVADYQSKMKSQDHKYQALKEQAEEKLQVANEEIEKTRKQTQGEMARLQAALRKAELQRQSMEQTIEQKNREIQELTSICDELIAKVGK